MYCEGPVPCVSSLDSIEVHKPGLWPLQDPRSLVRGTSVAAPRVGLPTLCFGFGVRGGQHWRPLCW